MAHKKPLAHLSLEDQQKLAAILIELESRGIDPSDKVKRMRTKKWSDYIAPNGYFANRDGKLYVPTEAQASFINSNARFVAFLGGRGSGKTAASAQKALRKIMKGEQGAVINPDFENFKVSTWPEFKNWIPWSLVVARQQHMASHDWEPLQPFVLHFVNGARVLCKGVKDPDSARGPNINWLWYDEGAKDDSGLSWKIAVASVRIGSEPQAWVSTTPNGIDHWVYDFFIARNLPEEAIKVFAESEKNSNREIIETFFGSIEDNKANLDPGFYASMLAAYADDPYLRKQELDGLFIQPGTTLGDRTWFEGKIIDRIPENETIYKRIRYWDLAASEKTVLKKRKVDPDETTGTLMAWNGSQTFWIEDQVGGCWEYPDIVQRIFETAIKDTPAVEIYIEQEPGSGGKNQIAAIKQELERMFVDKLGYLPAYSIRGHIPEGDKIVRANIWFSEAKKGFIGLIKGDWNDAFLSQLDSFPGGRKDDRVDGVSGARACIAPILLWKNVEFLKI